MERINIEFDDVPLPSRKLRHTWLERIPIGKSVSFDRLEATAAVQAAARHKRRHAGWNYTTKRDWDGGVRIWRTA